ncbi:translocation and assembly module TamB [Duganella sp. CF458]|uniref:translocation/assembly module TamB domain-containing protein n=1 Tax=Duganella sp. CF458 TaxID=1884368 RepID=UPI0008E059D3|nr:translocation/assembly module TamB domain-containing protein [Duganella sp. CF458]SFG19476.1 translocation and assembly module TamB [Duganella sp. CF458]
MDTPRNPPPADAPPPAAQRKWLRRTLLGSGVTLAVLGGAVWLLGREATLQQIVAQVARASGGQITVTGVSGSLYGRMHIGRIVYRDAASVLTLDSIDINWSPLQYFSEGVAISELHVARAESRSTGPSKPAVMPASIAPPFRLSIADGRVSTLALVGEDGSRTELRAIKLQLLGDGQHWQLKDASAETPIGALAASAEISTARPYKLSAAAALAPLPPAPVAPASTSSTTPPGAAAATPPDPGLVQRSATRLELLASGDLAQLKLDVKGKSHYANGDGSLLLAPFDALPLRSIRLHARDVDPARFDPAWPKAALDLTLDAAINGDRLSGKLAATNRSAAGPVDQQKLPLHSAAAQLGGTLNNASLSGLLIDLGAAGKFTGSGSLRRLPKDGSIDTAGVRLHTDRLDLRGLHSAAIGTAIAGDISAETKGKQHTLRAALGEGKLRLDVHATLQDLLLILHQARISAGQGSITATAQASLKDDKAFKASAAVRRFDPAALGAFPAADLNADLQAHGKLAPDWHANADIALQPSKLMGQALSGGVKLAADARHIANIDARLAYARNTATARGAFGAAADKLEWQLDAAQLSVLDAQLQGSATASGILGGGYQAPRTSFTSEARGLAYLAQPAGQRAAAAAPAPARADSVIRASGEAALFGAMDVKLSGSAARVNPASFGASIAGNVNADFDATLRASADWLANADIRLQAASTLGNAALSGHARFAASPGRVQDSDVDLRLGPNLLQAKGSFGKPQDRIDWKLDAPQLAVLGREWSGNLRGSGYASGGNVAGRSPNAMPTLSATLDGAHLRLPGQREISSIKGSATIGTAFGPDDPLQADLAVTGLNMPGVLVDRLRLQASGSAGNHTVQVAAANPDFDASAKVRGSFATDSWSGSIDALQNKGRFALNLQAPATLRVTGRKGEGVAGLATPEQLALGSATIAMPEGSLHIDTLQKNGLHWRSQGSAAGVNASYLAQLSDTWRRNVASTMTLGGDWSLELAAPAAKGAAPALEGYLHVFREKGDITITGGERPLPLDLKVLDARVTVAGDQLRAQAELAGDRAGNARLEASAQLRNGRIPSDSPLTFGASASLPSIAWLSPLLGVQGMELGGSLRAHAGGHGTIANPLLDGEVVGEGLVINWAEQGIRLRNGALQAKVSGDQLQLQRLRFDGTDGNVQADGWLRLAGGDMSMDLKLAANKLEVFNRPDRTLVLSGSSTLVRDAKRFEFDGKFKANRAVIELPSLDTPTISEDVVILGREKPKAAATTGLPLNIDLEADLGDDFTLRGKGLDAQLAGTVRVRMADRRAPRVNGSIRVVNGTYAAYGQRLAIERGVLNFTGAYDNPSLNIRAVRKRPEGDELSETNVEAGVEVRGTALAPAAKLVSTPSVPDSEKLAWMVLGHGTADMAGNEMSLLGTAAGALLGGSGGPSLANRVGLDELGVSQAKGLESTVVTVGKKLSSRAYISFEQGAGTATSLVKLRYKVNTRVTLQVQTGTNNALDVLYNWAFD